MVIARTKAFSLKKPCCSPPRHGRDISLSKISNSEYGYTCRNLTRLAKSVSLFWIGVPVIAHLLEERRAQHACARLLVAFCIVCARQISFRIQRERNHQPSSKTRRCQLTENTEPVTSLNLSSFLHIEDMVWYVVITTSNCLRKSTPFLFWPWKTWIFNVPGRMCLNGSELEFRSLQKFQRTKLKDNWAYNSNCFSHDCMTI